MQLSDQLKDKTAAELEEWFLEALESESLPLDDLLSVLVSFATAGDAAKCAEWSELLQDALSERGDVPGSLRLLQYRCGWQGDSAGFRRTCAEAARNALKDRLGQTFVKNVSFGKIPAMESVRRLTVLTNLKEGTFCHDDTWGFGVVGRLDDFYEKVTVNFRKKPSHQMSFSYAAETLQIVDDDHLQARLHSRPDELASLVKSQPDEVVRIALKSYGPLNVPDLQDLLVPDIVGEDEWKAFWDGSRKQLKRDPLFDLPSKRSEPMRLLESEKEYGDGWFSELAKERDPQRIFENVVELEKMGSASELEPDALKVVAERCSFALGACETRQPDLAARLLLMVERLGLPREGEGSVANVGEVRDCLLNVGTLRKAAAGLPARELQLLLNHISAHEGERLGESLLAVLPKLPVPALEPVICFLEKSPHTAAMIEVLQAEFGKRETSACLLAWAARNLERVDAWSVVDKYTLTGKIVDVLGVSLSGDDLKARKLLLEKLGQTAWMEQVLSALDAKQRSALFARIRLARGWDEAERRSLMARCIKLFPELEAAAADRETETTPRSAGRLTSWRSYRERQEAFRKLLEETIPENSREIGVALSYGDLRENFEYQAAKDRQRLLLQRKVEIERDLAEVKGSDFRGMSADRAGMGTCVSLEQSDGSIKCYCILGEWDRDEGLDIISSSSKLAQALEGHVAGDTVSLPGEDSEAGGKIVEVAGLTDEIRKWIAGVDS